MNKIQELETERTIMRRLSTDDAECFYNLNMDSEVLRYTGDKPFESIEAAFKFLSEYDQYEKYGVGRMAIINKSSSKFIGWCGLKYSPECDEYDIGFRFYRKYWNKGYATETAGKCIDYGFKEQKIERIIGRAVEENIASVNVLKKIGMKFKMRFDFEGRAGVIYELKNSCGRIS